LINILAIQDNYLVTTYILWLTQLRCFGKYTAMCSTR